MKAAVLGATGYTGGVLLRLLENHPEIDEILPVSSSIPGESIKAQDPGLGKGLSKCPEDKFLTLEEAQKANPAVVFAALPHLASAQACSLFTDQSLVVDLSADFRIKDPQVFQASYKVEWPFPALQKNAVYGLSEWYERELEGARLIANPGCYPTATLLPLLPLLKEKLVQGPFLVNALSGVSGAGKKATPNLLYVERDENTGAYSPGTKHRHQKEILQEVLLAGGEGPLLFNPHLVPLKRGMYVTQSMRLGKGARSQDLEEVLKQWAQDHVFLHYTGEQLPQSRNVTGTNRVDFTFQVEEEQVILFSAIDNLMKGASSQGIQNMNIALGLPQEMGLPLQAQV